MDKLPKSRVGKTFGAELEIFTWKRRLVPNLTDIFESGVALNLVGSIYLTNDTLVVRQYHVVQCNNRFVLSLY
jgi:hypothetical protein